VEPFVHVSPT
jgi:hypothetical protein